MQSITTCRRTSALYTGSVSTRGHGFRHRKRPEHLTRSFGKDAVEGFLDVAKLVSSSGSSGRTAFEELADRIGRDVYIDVNGWHLYLRDVKATPGFSMAQVLAQSLGPQDPDHLGLQEGPRLNLAKLERAVGGKGFRMMLVSRGYSEADVEQLLRKVPVKLGAGKINVPLIDVLPAMCVSDLMRACEEYRD